MTHIRLALLARDEAERLPQLAEQLGDRIQSVVLLVDDRTTDDTIDVAEALWGHLDGHVYPHKFKDFGTARNRLLELARPGADYLLLLDPDSPLIGTWPDELDAPAYECEWFYNGLVWPRTILLRTDTPAAYEGAVHEVIIVQADIHPAPDCHVEARVTAGPERLEWIESMLRRDAAVNPRSAFYLAQTLRDLDRLDEAFGWYMRRAAMGHGWIEETYCAVLEAGRLLNVYDYDLAAELWRRCIGLRPRAEAPFQLAAQANHRGLHSEALSWASLGLRMGASQDRLFVNRWIEQEGLMEQFNIAARNLMGPIHVAAPEPILEKSDG